jgi:peroxiredoxin
MKKLISRLLLCGTCFLVPCYATADPFVAMNIKPLSGTKTVAMDFRLNHLDGTTASLQDFSGKVVLLNFWATWCLPCIQEMPDMEKLWQQYKDAGLVVLGVSNDDAGKRKRVETFINKVNLSFPILLDPDSTISELYNVSAIPVSYLIDRNGVLLAKIVGVREWASPEAFTLIEHLLQPQY